MYIDTDYSFPVELYYPIGYIEAFIPIAFLSFQQFHTEERLQGSVLRASELGLNFLDKVR